MPLGQIPVLEYDGAVLSQSLTIARFLAKEFGLAGKTNLEQAYADMIIDTGNDLDNSKLRSNLPICHYLIVFAKNILFKCGT